MDHLPVDIHSQLLTKSIADPRWMAPEKTSSGQYKEELTPCNLSSSACFNGWGCHLASGTMDVPSINWWIRFSRAFCTVLYMWMMSSYTALTLFLILNMCEVFLIFSASINSASTLINAWLQLLQLNNSVWKYQDQVAFHYSNTHTDHLHLSPVLPTRKVYSISWEFWEFLQNVHQGWCRPPAAKRSRLLDSSAFYSKKLSAQKPDTPPSTVRCLQLTPLSANFSFMLEGKQSILFTDHKPLKFALFITSLPWSAMQQRRLSFQSEFLQVPPSPRSRQCCSWHPVRPELYRCIFLRNVPFQQSCLKVEFLCQLSTFLRLQS